MMIIPERLIKMLESCESEENACFPPTELFNEVWMLRLLLDGVQRRRIANELRFLPESKWYCEPRLSKPRDVARRGPGGSVDDDEALAHMQPEPDPSPPSRYEPGVASVHPVKAARVMLSPSAVRATAQSEGRRPLFASTGWNKAQRALRLRQTCAI